MHRAVAGKTSRGGLAPILRRRLSFRHGADSGLFGRYGEVPAASCPGKIASNEDEPSRPERGYTIMKRNGCERFRESLGLLASSALPDAEGAAVEAHLAACPDCRQYFEELRSLTVPLANWERSFAQIEPTPALQQRWRNAVVSAGESEPVRRLTLTMVLDELWREWIRPF